MARKRRKVYYGESHKDKRLNKYFAPIVADIKQYFFSLTTRELEQVLMHYKDTYGESAYQYARDTYTAWKYDRVKLSEQTLLRLVETLPQVLSSQKRIVLIEKLFTFYVDNIKFTRESITIEAYWDNYHQKLTELSCNIRQNHTLYFRPIDFDDNVLNLASWLSNDDMQVAKRILGECTHKKYLLASQSAQLDIKRFDLYCAELSSRNQTAGEHTLQILLPTAKIFVRVRTKPLTKRILGFFRQE